MELSTITKPVINGGAGGGLSFVKSILLFPTTCQMSIALRSQIEKQKEHFLGINQYSSQSHRIFQNVEGTSWGREALEVLWILETILSLWYLPITGIALPILGTGHLDHSEFVSAA